MFDLGYKVGLGDEIIFIIYVIEKRKEKLIFY